MVSILLLAQLLILFLLLTVLRQLPLMFRIFLGLIITWPVLNLYVQIDLPAGVPDIHYARAGVFGLVLCVIVTAAIAAKYRRSLATTNRALQQRRQKFDQRPQSASDPRSASDPSSEPQSDAVPSRAISSAYPMVASSHAEQGSEGYHGNVSGLPLLATAYVGLVGASFVAGFATGSVGSTAVATFLDSTLIPVAMYLFTRKYVDSPRRLVWLLGAILFSSMVICLTGIYENTMDFTHSPFPIAPINESGDTRWLGVPGGRAAGVLANPAIYGGVVGMGLLCCLTFFAHSDGRSKRLLFAGVGCVLAYGVFVSYTRSAWLSVAIAVFFSQFFIRGLWKMTVPLSLVAVLLAAITWGALSQNDLVQDRVMDTENVTGRVERIVWSWDRFLEHPILGQGPGALDAMMQTVFQEEFDTSHNTYLTMMVDYGFVRFALFLAVVASWLTRAGLILASSRRGQFEYSVVAAMVGFLLIWLLSGMSIELKLFPYFGALFWIAGGVIERLRADAVAVDLGRGQRRQRNFSPRIAGAKIGPRESGAPSYV